MNMFQMFYSDIPICCGFHWYFRRWALHCFCILYVFALDVTSGYYVYCADNSPSEHNIATDDENQMLITGRQSTGSMTCRPKNKALCEMQGKNCTMRLWVHIFWELAWKTISLESIPVFTGPSLTASFLVSVLSLVRMMGSALMGGEYLLC